MRFQYHDHSIEQMKFLRIQHYVWKPRSHLISSKTSFSKNRARFTYFVTLNATFENSHQELPFLAVIFKVVVFGIGDVCLLFTHVFWRHFWGQARPKNFHKFIFVHLRVRLLFCLKSGVYRNRLLSQSQSEMKM